VVVYTPDRCCILKKIFIKEDYIDETGRLFVQPLAYDLDSGKPSIDTSHGLLPFSIDHL
jgi:hypothetical protein